MSFNQNLNNNYLTSGGTITSGDTINSAISKLDGNIKQIGQETGVIYNEQFLTGTVATNYTNIGSTIWTLGSNIITVNIGAAGSGNYLMLNNFKIASDKFQYNVTTKVGDINTAGLLYGIPFFLGSFQFGLDTTISSASYLKVIENGVDMSSFTVGSTSIMSVSTGDIIDIKCTYNVDQAFITATNTSVVSRPTISFKYKTKLGTIPSLIGIGKLAIFSMGGGNHGFTKFYFKDTNKYNPEYVLIGDSITAGSLVYNEEYTYKSNLYNAGIDLVKLACGQANIDDFNIQEFINYLNLINPKKIILLLGSNSVTAFSGATAFTKYQSFITRLNTAGFTDITFCTLLDRSTWTTEINIFNTAMYANLPNSKIVHLNSIIGSCTQFADGIHPSPAINELMSDAILQYLNISKSYSKNKNNEIRTQSPIQIISGSYSGISTIIPTDRIFTGTTNFNVFNYRGNALLFNSNNNAAEIISYNNISGLIMSGVNRAQFGTAALGSNNLAALSILDLKTVSDNTIPFYMAISNPNGYVSQIYNRLSPLQLNDIYGWHLTNNTAARISGDGNVYFKLTKPAGYQSVLEFDTYNGNGNFGGSYYQIVNDASNNLSLINSGNISWQVNTSNQFGLGRTPLGGFLTIQNGTTTSSSIVLTQSISLVTTSASGDGSVATIGFPIQPVPPFYIGQTISVNGITPIGYNANVPVIACTTTSVSYLRSSTGSQTVAGTVSVGGLTSTPIMGAIEFDTNKLYFTPSTTRYQFGLTTGLTTGRIPFTDINGILTDSSGFTYSITSGLTVNNNVNINGSMYLGTLPVITSSGTNQITIAGGFTDITLGQGTGALNAFNQTFVLQQNQLSLTGTGGSPYNLQTGGFLSIFGLSINAASGNGGEIGLFGGGVIGAGTARGGNIYIDTQATVNNNRGSLVLFNTYISPNFQSMQRGIYFGNAMSEPISAATGGSFMWNFSGKTKFSGSIVLPFVGSGIEIKEGSNATMGTGTLVAGSATINTTKLTANSRIFIVRSLPSGTLGDIGEDSSLRTVGSSFIVKSMTLGSASTISLLDTSVFSWIIIEPN